VNQNYRENNLESNLEKVDEEQSNGKDYLRNYIEEQNLYDYFMYTVQNYPPKEVLQNFRSVFLDGSSKKNEHIYSVLEKILKNRNIDQDYKFILNRCCHILINRWQMQPSNQWAIPDLVSLFDDIRSPKASAPRTTSQIRKLAKDFISTDQFLALKRLARVIDQGKTKKDPEEKTQVGNLINRYPYLYEHCLLTEDSSYEHQQTVRIVQSQIQHKFELDLSHYVAYQVRLAQLARQLKSVQKAQYLLQSKPLYNPTLLTERDLGLALKQFTGRVQGGYSYRDLSKSFLSHSIELTSYEEFKDDLYEYLVTSVDPLYGKRKFNDRLYNAIHDILPQCNDKKLDQFLLLRTSSQLLNFLVVTGKTNPNHYVFVDLITNLGPTSTVGLLLKVVLLCNKVKPYLEKRFSILFNHYEASTEEGVPWLIQSLENLHIALSVHFGKADVSCLKQIM
jgi:hypothetical protein